MSQGGATEFLKRVAGDRQLQAELDAIATTEDLLVQAAQMGYVFSSTDLVQVLAQLRTAERESVMRGGCYRGVWRGPRQLHWDVAVYWHSEP